MARFTFAQVPTRDDLHALALALRGLRAANERHHSAHQDQDLPRAYASLFEGVMWIAALDERLCTLHGGDYKRAREQDPYGQVVLGIVWARDRHAHQLPVSINVDSTPFFGSGRGIIALSSGIRWRQAHELPPADPGMERGRTHYETHVAGRASFKPTSLSERWFTKLAETPRCVLQVAAHPTSSVT